MKKALPLIAVTALSVLLFFVLTPKDEGDMVRVSVGGVLWGEYPLSEDVRVKIDGVGNSFVIEKGRVKMETADCPDRICIKKGWISRSHETITCLPNKVVIEVIKSDDTLDLVV